MKNLLVELQTEELPPKALLKLSRAFADGIAKHLGQQHFLTEESVVAPYGSPRRLAVRITNVLEKSPDEAFAQKLVPVRVGLTAEGEATPALTKKMAALGIKCDVSFRTARTNSSYSKACVRAWSSPRAFRRRLTPPSRNFPFRRS